MFDFKVARLGRGGVFLFFRRGGGYYFLWGGGVRFQNTCLGGGRRD